MALPISSFTGYSSLSGKSTNSDNPVVLLTFSGAAPYTQITVLNEGTVAGFISIDNWTTPIKLPASSPTSITLGSLSLGVSGGTTLQFRRATGGSDVTGVSAFAL